MPVSSPTEFLPAGGSPPTRIIGGVSGQGATGVRVFMAGDLAGKFTTMSDLVIVGDSALSAGTQAAPISVAGLTFSSIVGSQSVKAATAFNNYGGVGGVAPLVVVGGNNVPAAVDTNGCQLIGSNIFTGWIGVAGSQGFDHNICIGDLVGQNLTAPTAGFGSTYLNVFIGTQTPSAGGSSAANIKRSVVIGHQALNGIVRSAATGGPGSDRNVIIGHNAGGGLGTIDNAVGEQQNVYLGAGAGAGINQSNATQCTVVGYQANASNPTDSRPQFSSCFGANSLATGNACLVLGAFATAGGRADRNIVIGPGANNAVVNLGNDAFLMETNDGVAPRRTMFFGVMCDGASVGTGLVIGFSTNATNRDLPGTGILKLLNGSASGVAPVGGGFFYSSAGNLHWVDTGNNDVQLSHAAGQLGASSSALTNNAAANAATLTNAPVAGNPTKWVPYNDNGTIRNMPLW